MLVLVTYDICSPRRIARVSKVLLDYGHRVQKSVFETEVDKGLLREMQRRVEAVLNAEVDSVKYYPVCDSCYASLVILGLGDVREPEPLFLVL